MLLIMIPDQYLNHYKALEIYTGYFNSLDNMILFVLSQQYRNNERLLYLIYLLTVVNFVPISNIKVTAAGTTQQTPHTNQT